MDSIPRSNVSGQPWENQAVSDNGPAPSRTAEDYERYMEEAK